MSSEKYIEVFSDASTGETFERELSFERLEELKASQLSSEESENLRQISRQSAISKLEALGLTEEEIAAL
jgi:hypothetical protein